MEVKTLIVRNEAAARQNGASSLVGAHEPKKVLESLIESFIELMSQVFMLPIFHRRTSC